MSFELTSIEIPSLLQQLFPDVVSIWKYSYGYRINTINNDYFFQIVTTNNGSIDVQVNNHIKGVRKNYKLLSDVNKNEVARLMSAFDNCSDGEWLQLES